jgi:coproporphyrinogen III oxidase
MRTLPKSEAAAAAREVIESLQERLQAALERVSGETFTTVRWLRDEGRHGGGNRRVAPQGGTFNRASVNMSVVHYDDDPSKRLGSATALSSIVHPDNPAAPSMHTHVSWTEMKDGTGYWRIMGDLNPSIPVDADRDDFAAAMKAAAPDVYAYAAEQGDRYFAIPALGRHRGVTHFYVEGYATDDPAADLALARRTGEAIIDAYAAILERRLAEAGEPSEADRAEQLAYHTLYLFQVLTLDRGTTSGLLVHSQNDVGILGSLPSHCDRELLASWADAVPELQRPLVVALAEALGGTGAVLVDEAAKKRLASAVRSFYQANPSALELQARGDVLPPTVANHR